MATDVIPAKYKRILKIIKINTNKTEDIVRVDFLKYYYKTRDFQKSMILLHNKYVHEKEEM